METPKWTPMMEQYLKLKEQYKEEILFFRLGDFYEMFFDDAILASRELELTLTGRAGGDPKKVPMCGIPYHAADNYIARLVQKGYKVAICEQLEDPKAGKGIVKRDIIKVITPGTILLESAITDKTNNYLAGIVRQQDKVGISLLDVTTGECFWRFIDNSLNNREDLFDVLAIYQPSELIYSGMDEITGLLKEFLETRMPHCVMMPYEVTASTDYPAIAVRYFSADQLPAYPVMTTCLGLLLHYVETVMKTDISHINLLQQIDNTSRLVMDAASLRHLEITQNVRDGGRKGTLLDILDYTHTAMGGRLLKKWLESPLVQVHDIRQRQHTIVELLENEILRNELASILDGIYDFERILTRIETGSVSPKDLVALRESLQLLPPLKDKLSGATANLLQSINEMMGTHEDVLELLCQGIADEPAIALKSGGIIREGYSAALDELRSLATNSKAWLQNLEAEEKEKTGIRLKIGYTRVFGYYFEISHANSLPIPEYYIRKQTLVNAERYITPELKEFEVKVLTAQEKILALEYDLYNQLRQAIKSQIPPMQLTARAIAQLDCLHSLSEAAYQNRYVQPQITTNKSILIRDGRHPIIEKYLKKELFVPNDVRLNHVDHEVLVITGPNMAGKSTYMRQVAVLTLMAQVGSFVPAREAAISPVDRIFTRIGASDDILSGQSTFMVEMKEVSYILNHATPDSLIILDEIGRGTSTFDGMSIARAVIEYCIKHIHGMTLFATHYHELVEMADHSDKIKNYTVAVKERGKSIKFLRRIIPGGADRSYGIHVAQLAGLPDGLIKRANEVLAQLEAGEAAKMPAISLENKSTAGGFDNLFTNPLIEKLASIDVMSLTPVEALNVLYKLQQEAKTGVGNS